MSDAQRAPLEGEISESHLAPLIDVGLLLVLFLLLSLTGWTSFGEQVESYLPKDRGG